MACQPFCLRTDGLTGADAGGTWTVVSGSYSGSLAGDDPCINWQLLPVGTSVTFEYSLPGCSGGSSTSQVVLYSMDIGSMNNCNYTICVSETSYDVADCMNISVGDDGTLTWGGYNGAGFNQTTGIFDPSAAGVGVYTITATINATPPGGYTDVGCCDDIHATAIITVVNAANAGTGGQYAVC